MWEALTWVYLANATMLVVHEIDSAYWKEWRLFGLPGGISLFLVVHVPLVGLVLWGLLEVRAQSTAGVVFSLALAAAGMLAFTTHAIFILKGHREFNAPVSVAVLLGTLLSSLVQATLATYVIFA